MPATTSDQTVRVPVEGSSVEASLVVPPGAAGVVVFAHGGGGDRLDPRDAILTAELHRAGFATLDFELLTAQELREPDYRFNASAVARRLSEIVEWTGRHESTHGLPVGILANGTGMAAALIAAARTGSGIRALVSRGGRPELAGDAPSAVCAPTLFIVGGHDWANIDLNEAAVEKMKAPAQMAVVPLATHFFEEDGTLEEAAKLAGEWFRKWMGR